MLLLFLLTVFTVSLEDDLFDFQSYQELCYGRDLRFPFGYSPPLYKGPMYFSPSNGEPRRLLMDNGKAMDPRISIFFSSISLQDVTEEYDGDFSISFDGEKLTRILTLKILDCADHVIRNYGGAYEYQIPTQAEFMEFTPLQSLHQRKILWNRTDPAIHSKTRGWVVNGVWKIFDITQNLDNGYYNFRQHKDNRLVSRIRLTVEEQSEDMRVKEGNVLHITYAYRLRMWTATFTPEGKTAHEMIIEDGQVLEYSRFDDRIQFVSGGIEVAPAELLDSGTFEFRDSEDNLMLSVHVEVESGFRTDILLSVLLFLILPIAIICCCCYCCKQACGKKNQSPAQTSTALAVSSHDHNQPSGPSYSTSPSHSAFSDQPVKPLVPTEPGASDDLPPVAPPGRLETAPAPSAYSDCLSSGNEPHFEVKGMTFPSAPPLNSDSTFSDVYTSDKLNFL